MAATQRKGIRNRALPRGVVLVFSAGILTILAALGMSFYTLTQSSTMSAVRYSDMVRADLLARAGINDAIARLREQAFAKTEDPSDPWFMTDYLNHLQTRFSFIEKEIITNKPLPYSRALGSTVMDNGDRYTLQIQDAASKININAGDNLAVILDNLCRLIGPPLVAADLNAIQPRRWAAEGATVGLYDNTLNALDTDTDKERDLYYRLNANGRPIVNANGVAICGDGYAIAGYRSHHGRFGSIAEIRDALTFIERNGNGLRDDPLEQLEVEAKFAVLKDYLTTDSWVDTTTVGVGKFEWVWLDTITDARVPAASGTDTDPATGATVNVYDLQGLESGTLQCQILIDRDKSWIADDPVNDPLNQRGSLRGSYVSIMNGHGAGQLRRIATNGTDWIAIRSYDPDERMTVPPGPISSYLIMAREDAKLELVPNTTPPTYVPRVRIDGSLPDDSLVDYAIRPLCIHRSPVNINTASDKVLAALFMGINVQHGHPMAVGTNAEWPNVVPDPLPAPPVAVGSAIWKSNDYSNRSLEPYLLTLKGLKRVPADSGKLMFDRARPAEAPFPAFNYLDNEGMLPYLNAAHELAHRVIVARQATDWDGNVLPADPYEPAYARGPFKSWDDLFFRVVKPWDEERDKSKNVSVARLIMANFNNNTDILKFNPGIEWIDRFGRNFAEMEPVMVYADGANEPTWVPFKLNFPAAGKSDGMWNATLVNSLFKDKGSYVTRSLRYKADDLIDKTDLNRSTTEFAFDSGGIYEIVSTGQVFGPVGLLAERKLETLVKVYDVWRESTQDQFVRGYISEATNATGAAMVPDRSGRIVRDARNTTAPYKRLALDTWPEPLVPLGYTVPKGNNGTASDTDLVSTEHYDGWKNQKPQRRVPDVVSNRVLPARYDGQIALATNTSKYGDTGDTFLASFDGDLDTGTCKGNGREEAKSPDNYKIRVLDTISLLGLLNDTEVDFDPAPKDTFVVPAANSAMNALNPTKYWHNVTCRMGDLRPEGVFLGNVGASGRDATIKYPVAGNWPVASGTNDMQYAVRMWMKPTWHLDDGQEHEFFNGCNTGDGWDASGATFKKVGKFSGAMRRESPGSNDPSAGGGGGGECNLSFHTEDKDDHDMGSNLHGGVGGVPLNDASVPNKESPAFRVQPFRWHYLGCVSNYDYYVDTDATVDTADGKNWNSTGFYSGTNPDCTRGRWAYGGGLDPVNVELRTNRQRTFIDTARDPEGPSWSARYHYGMTNDRSMANSDLGADATNPQMAAWSWANRASATASNSVWGINNLNNSPVSWLYRSCSIDGTQAVVDELKISVTKTNGGGNPLPNGVWGDDRFATEMTTSRYYLPSNPGSQAEQPTFTSQTLLSSQRGSNSTDGEEVTVVRVSWNCFTPRFMHENKSHQNARTRKEAIGDRGGGLNSNNVQAQGIQDISYRGPFDYIQYNFEILPAPTTLDPRNGEAKRPGIDPNGLNVKLEFPAGSGVFPLHCERPARKDYPVDAVSGIRQAHASRGIEVELIRDPDGNPGNGDDTILDGKTFTNPDGTFANPVAGLPPVNALGSALNPIKVKSGQLRYRVRFKYPIDHFVQQVYGVADATVDPAKHYTVDTPVFDDISVTYFTKTRVLTYREVTE